MVTVVNQELVCQELRPRMGPVDLLSKMRSGVLGLEDHAVHPQAFVALPKLFAVPAVSLPLATMRQMIQDLPAMFGLIRACVQV